MLRPAKDKNFPDPARLKTLPTPIIEHSSQASPIFLEKVLQLFNSSFFVVVNKIRSGRAKSRFSAMHCFYYTPLLQKKKFEQ